jgi:hypothetical protein
VFFGIMKGEVVAQKRSDGVSAKGERAADSTSLDLVCHGKIAERLRDAR